MHSLIEKKMVKAIRDTGKAYEELPDRKKILEENGLPYDREAENIIISGCIVLSTLPLILKSLVRIFDQKRLSYSFMSKEYCCGNNLYRPAIKARDEEAMAECRELSREFVEKNIQQGKRLGAKRFIIFCSPCYPIYRHAFPGEEIVFYPAAIRDIMGFLEFKEKVDYYAGCYKLHNKFSPVPMDLSSSEEVFLRMKGLEVLRIGAPACCFKPAGLSHMIESVRTGLMVHICTGCYGQAIMNMPKDRDVEILMLPELVERAMA